MGTYKINLSIEILMEPFPLNILGHQVICLYTHGTFPFEHPQKPSNMPKPLGEFTPFSLGHRPKWEPLNLISL